MLRAAFTSRSCLVSQPVQAHWRTDRSICCARTPHTEHNRDDGYQRGTTTSVRPYSAALYSSRVRIGYPCPAPQRIPFPPPA
jgi:hypothetical protein